jgi:hypothetical protein
LVVLIERTILLSGESEDSGKIAIEVNFQLSQLVRPQFDSVDERAQNICRFAPGFLPVQHMSKVCHLPAVFRRHVRMKQHRLFLGPGEQRFQLFAPQGDAGEIIFDFGGG